MIFPLFFLAVFCSAQMNLVPLLSRLSFATVVCYLTCPSNRIHRSACFVYCAYCKCVCVCICVAAYVNSMEQWQLVASQRRSIQLNGNSSSFCRCCYFLLLSCKSLGRVNIVGRNICSHIFFIFTFFSIRWKIKSKYKTAEFQWILFELIVFDNRQKSIVFIGMVMCARSDRILLFILS